MNLTKGQIKMIQNMVNTELSNKNTVYNSTELVSLKEQLLLCAVGNSFYCYNECSGYDRCKSTCNECSDVCKWGLQ